LKAFEGCGEAFLEKFPTRVSFVPPTNQNLKYGINSKLQGVSDPIVDLEAPCTYTGILLKYTKIIQA